MSQVFLSGSTGAAIYVFSDDHCPPHVHARHRGGGWIARVSFSFADNRVALMSIAPLKAGPLRRIVNRLLDDIQMELPTCRARWWTTRKTTCLANQWAIMPDHDMLTLTPGPQRDARQVADAIYEPGPGRLRVTFLDGTTADVRPFR